MIISFVLLHASDVLGCGQAFQINSLFILIAFLLCQYESGNRNFAWLSINHPVLKFFTIFVNLSSMVNANAVPKVKNVVRCAILRIYLRIFCQILTTALLKWHFNIGVKNTERFPGAIPIFSKFLFAFIASGNLSLQITAREEEYSRTIKVSILF